MTFQRNKKQFMGLTLMFFIIAAMETNSDPPPPPHCNTNLIKIRYFFLP